MRTIFHRCWPRSLFGRIALILFGGLAAAHLLTVGLLLYDRLQATSALMIAYLAKDVASSVAMLDRLPPGERPPWLGKLDRQNYHYQLAASAGGTSAPDLTRPIHEALSRELTEYAFSISSPSEPSSPFALSVQLALHDGTPLTIEIAPPSTGLSPWVASALCLQLAVLGVFTWLAVRTVTQPLEKLARAADQLGPEFDGARVPEDGPTEVAHAAAAFNAMQQRIADHLTERIQILAAVSHDLQSPITRMRLRVDTLEDDALKTKMQADLVAMQELVREGIEFVKSSSAAAESPVATDLQALLESLVYDYADAGQEILLQGRVDITFVTRPSLLRRLLINLIDNALKFGREVTVRADIIGRSRITIAVCDRGPGIPPDELQAVVRPFHRLELSRSRETGGTGLGLAIAEKLAGSLAGELKLSNRAGGGLEASVTIPCLTPNGAVLG
jgi:signal transduction histidine kinase